MRRGGASLPPLHFIGRQWLKKLRADSQLPFQSAGRALALHLGDGHEAGDRLRLSGDNNLLSAGSL